MIMNISHANKTSNNKNDYVMLGSISFMFIQKGKNELQQTTRKEKTIEKRKNNSELISIGIHIYRSISSQS